MFVKSNANDDEKACQALIMLDENINKLTSLKRKYQEAVNAVGSVLADQQRLRDSGLIHITPPELSLIMSNETVLDLLGFLRSVNESTYKAATDIASPIIGFGGGVSLSEAEMFNYEHIGKSIYGIEAILDDGDIWVKTPMLENRIKILRQAFSEKSQKEYSRIYSIDIDRAMRYLILENPELRPYEYRKKTLDFIFIYDAKCKYPCDSDSHDTKAVIDAITAIFGADDAFSCSVSYSSARTDAIPMGTYIRMCKASKRASAADSMARLGAIKDKFSD